MQGDGASEGASVVYSAAESAYFVKPEARGETIPAATLAAGAGCTRQDNGQVRCPAAGNRVITATLGGGADSFTGAGAKVLGDMFVDGGAGNDVVQGGLGFDALDGAAGNDDLNGFGGADVVEGGDGDDVLRADNRAADEQVAGPDTLRGEGGDDRFRAVGGPSGGSGDRLDGGPGRDTADYSGRTAGVTLRVNIGGARVADDGAPGEGDDIGEDVEGLTGGAGADILEFTQAAGAAGPPLLGLTGNAGKDRLISDTAISTVFDPGIGPDHGRRAARPATASSAATRSTTASTATAGSTATAPICATARSRPSASRSTRARSTKGPTSSCRRARCASAATGRWPCGCAARASCGSRARARWRCGSTVRAARFGRRSGIGSAAAAPSRCG